MIGILEARKILGPCEAELTDEQIENMLYLMYNLVNRVIDNVIDGHD